MQMIRRIIYPLSLFLILFCSDMAGQHLAAPPSFELDSLASWTSFAELGASQGENASLFGQSVSVNGTVAVVGSPGDEVTTGAAYVFVKSAADDAKILQTARLTASDGQPGDVFGYSVSISGDTIVVGAQGVNTSQGKAYVFVKPPTGWVDMTETAQITASDGRGNDQFGISVAISGNTIVVGSPNHDVGSNSEQGAIYLFAEPPGGWIDMSQTAQLTASDGTEKSGLGYSVSASGNAVVGGAAGVGAVYVFVEPQDGWRNMTQSAKLTDPHDTGIGFSVGISGNTIATGSPSGSIGNGPTGAVDVYVRPGNSWRSTTKPTARLGASDGDVGDDLGWSVATTGNTVTAGAPFAHCLGVGCQRGIGTGIAYAFSRPANGWASMTQTQELIPSDGVPKGSFGESIAANGPAVSVGASGTNTAYVYLYRANR
jgi:hypothetical protein